MKKDISRSEQFPISRHANIFGPWFEEYMGSRWLNDFFSRELTPFSSNSDKFLSPAIDIDETSNEYIVTADLPGIKKEDLSIECSGNQLTISAERKYESPEGRRNERKERFYGTYKRSFTLPTGIDADKIEANFEAGELTVHIPKGEQAKTKVIQIGEKKSEPTQPKGSQKSSDRH